MSFDFPAPQSNHLCDGRMSPSTLHTCKPVKPLPPQPFFQCSRSAAPAPPPPPRKPRKRSLQRASAMSVPPPAVGRTLYRALLRGAARLEQELERCQMPARAALHAREVALLRAALQVPVQMPCPARCVVREAARMESPDGAAGAVDRGFDGLRLINRRVLALGQLVYEQTSETVTSQIRVTVTSRFNKFEPASQKYLYDYDVKIVNEGDESVKLLGRRWDIVDLNGNQDTVEGLGVIGSFPWLDPGESFEYSSGTPLSTAVGTQSGHYLFISNISSKEDAREEAQSDELLQAGQQRKPLELEAAAAIGSSLSDLKGEDLAAVADEDGEFLDPESAPRAVIVRVAPFALGTANDLWHDDDEGNDDGEGGSSVGLDSDYDDGHTTFSSDGAAKPAPAAFPRGRRSRRPARRR